ncbi:hypothetical protein J1N51_01930 [Psychrosphaera ytuae]|uniref:DUF3784 domain-containing protein n=1 Tax=Psychrosphaera ytuae TaxID=2820710 RepID=A0A975DBT3_9GAMM|nr:hypothetical protein [Psychrosphaera ytuae]QTH64267.1 hypothetical protein J1N51_01930 [Psychrosphaera ytuae]
MIKLEIGALIVLVTAILPCLICGYLIVFHGRRGLISGWDDSKFSNPEGAGKLVGISLIIMALLLGLATLLWFAQLITEIMLIYAIVPISLVPVLTLVYVKIKFSVK